jgi:hypothetical protein
MRAARFTGLTGLWLLAGVAPAAAQLTTPVPEWWVSHEELMRLFDAEAMTRGIEAPLRTFSTVFMLIGFAAVLISAVQRVARARTGEESLGWVAGMVMTVALMATGPAIGGGLFRATNALAKDTQWSHEQTIPTAWKALRVILSPESPASQVLETAEETNEEEIELQDAAWTKRAWTWMKRAWGAMKNATAGLITGLREAVTHVLIFVILLVPALGLLSGMVLMAFGSFFREVLHQVMDVFLPMMIALLSFSPLRDPALKFIIRYVSVALWPFAWALGNALAVSLLTSTMEWVVNSCREVLTAQAVAISVAVPSQVGGLLAGAAPMMSWSLLIVLVAMIVFSALLLNASAVVAPIALTRVLTQGACFAQTHLREAMAVVGQGGVGSDRAPGHAGTGIGGAAPGGGGSGSGGALAASALHLKMAASAGGIAAPFLTMAAGVVRHASGVLGGGAHPEEDSFREGGRGRAERPPPSMRATLAAASTSAVPAARHRTARS